MSYNINLASKKEANTIDKIVDFFSNYLRYALVMTMLVLLGVFFFRLRIDQNIEELEDSIGQKRQIFQVVKPLLTHAGLVDARMKAVDSVVREQERQLEIFNLIYSSFPEQLFLTRLTFDTTGLVFSGTASDPRILEMFYKKLKTHDSLKSIVLNKVRRTETDYEFTFTIAVPKKI